MDLGSGYPVVGIGAGSALILQASPDPGNAMEELVPAYQSLKFSLPPPQGSQEVAECVCLHI